MQTSLKNSLALHLQGICSSGEIDRRQAERRWVWLNVIIIIIIVTDLLLLLLLLLLFIYNDLYTIFKSLVMLMMRISV